MTLIARTLAALAAALLASAVIASGDEYDPDPNRMPGPKHFNPASCKQYPEVCKAREDHLRRQYLECKDRGGSNCTLPPSLRKNKKKPSAPTPAAAEPATPQAADGETPQP